MKYSMTCFLSFFLFFSFNPVLSKTQKLVEKNKIKSPIQTSKPIQKVKFKLIAALIKGDGTIIPVPRTEFEIRQYSITQIKKDLEKKFVSNIEEKSTENFKLLKEECEVELKNDVDYIFFSKNKEELDSRLNDCYSKKINKLTDLWQEEFDNQLNIVKNEMEKKFPTIIKVKTDLSGVAVIELPLGTWYISGNYSYLDHSNKINWDTLIEVKPELEKFELSNDNGNIE